MFWGNNWFLIYSEIDWAVLQIIINNLRVKIGSFLTGYQIDNQLFQIIPISIFILIAWDSRIKTFNLGLYYRSNFMCSL